MALIKASGGGGSSKEPVEHIFDGCLIATTTQSQWTKTFNVTKSGKGLICLLYITNSGGSGRLQILKNGTSIFDETVTPYNKFIDIDFVEGDVITFKKFGANLVMGFAGIV